MTHSHRTQKSQVKKVNTRKTEEKILTGVNVRGIADAFILSIEDRYMTYRDFKRIQEILDRKYWKPDWVPEKRINA